MEYPSLIKKIISGILINYFYVLIISIQLISLVPTSKDYSKLNDNIFWSTQYSSSHFIKSSQLSMTVISHLYLI